MKILVTGAKVAVYRFPNLMGHSGSKYNSADCGQISINISKPGIKKGEH